MSSASHKVLLGLCLMVTALTLTYSAPFPGGSEEEVEAALAQDGDGGLEEVEKEEEEFLPVPDPFLAPVDPRLAYYYAPDFLPEDADNGLDLPIFPSPLKRGRYNRLDILKRSRLNQLIHRLLAMRGDRYSYHRASPVRFAAGRR